MYVHRDTETLDLSRLRSSGGGGIFLEPFLTGTGTGRIHPCLWDVAFLLAFSPREGRKLCEFRHELSLTDTEAGWGWCWVDRDCQVMVVFADGKLGNEIADQRQARIASLKVRMPWSICKVNGRIIYGHCHSDPECPFFGKGDGKASKGVFGVTPENEVLSTDSEELFIININIIYGIELASIASNGQFLALSDTCCARTVAGSKWIGLWRSFGRLVQTFIFCEKRKVFALVPVLESGQSTLWFFLYFWEKKRNQCFCGSVWCRWMYFCWLADKFYWIWV